MVLCIPFEVLLLTLQSTNSTRYQHLIEELFTQDPEGSCVSEFTYFVDPQDAKKVSQKVRREGVERGWEATPAVCTSVKSGRGCIQYIPILPLPLSLLLPPEQVLLLQRVHGRLATTPLVDMVSTPSLLPHTHTLTRPVAGLTYTHTHTHTIPVPGLIYLLCPSYSRNKTDPFLCRMCGLVFLLPRPPLPGATPLLIPRSGLYSGLESVAHLLDRSGSIVSLLYNHRVSRQHWL